MLGGSEDAIDYDLKKKKQTIKPKSQREISIAIGWHESDFKFPKAQGETTLLFFIIISK